jgi:hypothetical protein
MREDAVPGTNQAISPQKSQNNAGFRKQEIEMPPCHSVDFLSVTDFSV